MSAYRIPSGVTRVETRAGNSRFIATLTAADTPAAAHEFLRAIRAEFPDATHHVYAFRAGFGASVQEGMSDDGEPSGTSGPPALAVLRGCGLGDVAVVITRYFGGTKLGTGGLVAAYTAAVQAVLAAAPTELKVNWRPATLSAPYKLLEPLRRAITAAGGIIEGEDFGAEITMRLRVPEESFDTLSREIQDLSAGRSTLTAA
jgi:uncharacterized YigZ family protein